MKILNRHIIIGLICLFTTPTLNLAYSDDAAESENKEESPLEFEAVLTHDYVKNMSGGIKEDSGNLGNIDLTLTLDTEKAGAWEGGTLFFYYLGNYGNEPSSFIGDEQVTSNIEAYSTFKVYEFWYNQSLIDNQLNILVGLFDLNSEFDALEYASTLINSSFGISADIAQVGPSIFNTTSLATRVRGNFSHDIYLQSAVFDGVPGDPNDPSGTQIKFGDNDGVFWATEAGQANDAENENYSKVALGYWRSTAEFHDFNDQTRDFNQGFYFIAESAILHEEDTAQGLGAFFQSGIAKKDRNAIGSYFGGGLQYTGLVPSRDSDVTALGFASAVNSNDYKKTSTDLERTETAFEFTHLFNINDHFSLQPDLQYIVNPSTNKTIDDAFVFTLRGTVAF